MKNCIASGLDMNLRKRVCKVAIPVMFFTFIRYSCCLELYHMSLSKEWYAREKGAGLGTLEQEEADICSFLLYFTCSDAE